MGRRGGRRGTCIGHIGTSVVRTVHLGDAGPIDLEFFFGLLGGFILREAFPGTQRIEQRVGDVAEDSGAARSDAIFGKQGENASKKANDIGIAAESGEFGRKTG
jgi:hypothetical protein